MRGVGVDDFTPVAGQWHANSVIVPRHGSEVEDCNDRASITEAPFISINALSGIIADNPAKTLRI